MTNNSNNQAQKGFKTFLATLVVSFFVFSAVYYVATELGTDTSLSDSLEITTITTAQETKVLGSQDRLLLRLLFRKLAEMS
jgi:hypothetical protein